MRSLKASLRKFGFVDPIVVNRRQLRGRDGGLICVGGHQRLIAWKELGHDTIPTIVVELNEEDEMTLNVSLNNQAGEWDEVALAKVLATLDRLGVDPTPTGFTDGQLARALQSTEAAARALEREDEAPALPAKPRTKPGELIVLGRHRLLCGDATKEADVRRLMDGKRSQLMATDPPYLVGYDSTDRIDGRGLKSARPTFSDAPQRGLYAEFLTVAIDHALADRPAIYQWHGETTRPELDMAWTLNDVLFHQLVIWHKTAPVFGRRHYMNEHECCAYGWRRGKTPRFKPKSNDRDVWVIDKDTKFRHPTQKPVELFRRPILSHTRPDDAVYEPFAGSGSCLVASELSGRSCFAMELEPAFCDVIRERFQQLSK